MKNEYLAVWEGELLQLNSPPFSMDSITYRKGFVKHFEEVFEIFFLKSEQFFEKFLSYFFIGKVYLYYTKV